MIEISFFVSDGKTVKVASEGHSGYAESGSDIVCAAVSTLVQTAFLAIKDIGCQTEYVRKDDGYFAFTIGDGNRHDAEVIVRALRVGLTDLEHGYPQYIKTETVTNGGN